jgi:hypothetical protein
MKNSSEPDPPPAAPALSESDNRLIRAFQAYLHVVITAEQGGQRVRLDALPGPQMLDYCHRLAKLPGNTLAVELARPVQAILHQIAEAELDCRRRVIHKQVKDAADQAQLDRVLEQLDYALALMMRRLPLLVRDRAEVTKCQELLCVTILQMAIGDGVDAARLIRRWQREYPEGDRHEDGTMEPDSFPDLFAWDAYQRIAALDDLADEFPEHIRTAARFMHAWPMLMHRHTNNRRRFEQLAKRLELGADYPIDASEGARYRPDTPLVRYLDPHIYRLHNLWSIIRGEKYESIEVEKRVIAGFWREWPEAKPSDEVFEVLRGLHQLPPLTKATAHQWAEKAVVPLILATDARDWTDCEEPVLQRIARQKGVKSRATFKSRLLAAVSAALHRLARAE